MENEIKTGLPILNIYCGTNQFLTKVAEFVFFSKGTRNYNINIYRLYKPNILALF